jgi:DNA mismatch repair endonuclease MutH
MKKTIENFTYITPEEILEKSKEAINVTFGEIDSKNRLKNNSNKGNLGQIIEEDLFHYKVNSKAEPDFIEAGVELKVTPYKLNKNGSYSAKERLVLNIINYENEATLEFENSSFWEKNKHLLLMFYLHDFDIYKKDMKVTHTILYDFPDKDDLEIIKKDYSIIHKKIKDGLAHEISESDTMYLAACTKGANAKTMRNQPNSDKKAKQRAFSLKASYMTYLFNRYALNQVLENKILEDVNTLGNKTFEQYIYDLIKVHFNKNIMDLYEEFDISTTAKNRRAMLVSRILNVDDISKSAEFIKSGMKFKTVFIDKLGNLKESMSFPTFDYFELSQETWEDANIKEMFETTRFVFAVFKEDENGSEIFDDIIFWNMPNEIIEKEVKSVWSKTKGVIKKGEIVYKVKTNSKGAKVHYTNFPGICYNKYVHVRPHARNFEDTLALPKKDKLTGYTSYQKHCFWLNSEYVLDIINSK